MDVLSLLLASAVVFVVLGPFCHCRPNSTTNSEDGNRQMSAVARRRRRQRDQSASRALLRKYARRIQRYTAVCVPPHTRGGEPLVAVTCGQMSLGLRRRKGYRMTCSMRNRNPDGKVKCRVKFRCIIRKFYSASLNSVLGS